MTRKKYKNTDKRHSRYYEIGDKIYWIRGSRIHDDGYMLEIFERDTKTRLEKYEYNTFEGVLEGALTLITDKTLMQYKPGQSWF